MTLFKMINLSLCRNCTQKIGFGNTGFSYIDLSFVMKYFIRDYDGFSDGLFKIHDSLQMMLSMLRTDFTDPKSDTNCEDEFDVR